MRPTFPSLLVGNPIERANAYVFPIYVAQLNLFDFARKPSWSVADTRQKQKVLAINRRLDGPKYAAIVNRSDQRLLFVQNNKFSESPLHLTCSILVPPKTTIRIPSLCYVSYLRLTGSPLWPPENAVGWAACGLTDGK